MPNKSVQCVYLHGFASGPASAKARFFKSELPKLGLNVHVPDLNGSDFRALTLSGQLEIIDNLMRELGSDDKVLFMGSSMGGLLSVLAAKKYPNVRALILLAPGFGLNHRWHELLGPDQLKKWRQIGTIDIFHYALNRNVPLDYAFIEDAEHYQTQDLMVDVPTMVIHGIADTVVPPIESEKFQANNSDKVELHLLKSDHALIDVLDEMATLLKVFLEEHDLVSA